jgi:hypothetical protein
MLRFLSSISDQQQGQVETANMSIIDRFHESNSILFMISDQYSYRRSDNVPWGSENRSMATPYLQPAGMRLASLVTTLNVLIASGFSIAALVSPEAVLPAGQISTDASFIFALYAAARTIPLALITLLVIYKQAASALLILGALAGAIQAFDAVIGLFQHDPGKSIGPLIIAALQLWVLLRLNRSMRPV